MPLEPVVQSAAQIGELLAMISEGIRIGQATRAAANDRFTVQDEQGNSYVDVDFVLLSAVNQGFLTDETVAVANTETTTTTNPLLVETQVQSSPEKLVSSSERNLANLVTTNRTERGEAVQTQLTPAHNIVDTANHPTQTTTVAQSGGNDTSSHQVEDEEET